MENPKNQLQDQKKDLSLENTKNQTFLKTLEKEECSKKIKTIFLLKLTESLIKASSPLKFIKVKEKEKLKKEQVKKKIKKKTEKRVKFASAQSSQKNSRPRLRIPKTRLPEQFSYLKPTPSKEQIDLGKLNPFLKDPAIEKINILGPNKYATVEGRMGTKPAAIKMNSKEIKEIIKKISQKSKIPLEDDITKIAYGNMIISTNMKDRENPKFTIKKIPKRNKNEPPKKR